MPRKWIKFGKDAPFNYKLNSIWLNMHTQDVILSFVKWGKPRKYSQVQPLYEIQWKQDGQWKHWVKKNNDDYQYLYTINSAKQKAFLFFGNPSDET